MVWQKYIFFQTAQTKSLKIYSKKLTMKQFITEIIEKRMFGTVFAKLTL